MVSLPRYLAEKIWQETPNIWSQEDVARVESIVTDAMDNAYKKGIIDSSYTEGRKDLVEEICKMIREYEDPEDLIEAVRAFGDCR